MELRQDQKYLIELLEKHSGQGDLQYALLLEYEFTIIDRYKAGERRAKLDIFREDLKDALDKLIQ